MLTTMEVYGTNPSAPIIELDSTLTAQSDPFQIKEITGLGPVAATIATSPFGAGDGEFITGMTVGKRNIVITFGLNPRYTNPVDDTNTLATVADLRMALYAYFMPKEVVTLLLHSTHMEDVTIQGYVESLDPNMFSKDPEVQVSIICPVGNFVAVSLATVTQTTGDEAEDFTYFGTLPTGFTIRWDRDPSASGDPHVTLTLSNPFPHTFVCSAPVGPSGHFKLSSVQGSKYVRSIDGTVTKNLLFSVDPSAVWPVLLPGPNTMLVTNIEVGASDTWELEYFAQYGGI